MLPQKDSEHLNSNHGSRSNPPSSRILAPTQPNRDIEFSKEEIFENKLNQCSTKVFHTTMLSSKRHGTVFLETTNIDVEKYFCSFSIDLHALPNSINDAVPRSNYMTHPGSWEIISLSQNALLPYMHRDLIAKAVDCAPC